MLSKKIVQFILFSSFLCCCFIFFFGLHPRECFVFSIILQALAFLSRIGAKINGLTTNFFNNQPSSSNPYKEPMTTPKISHPINSFLSLFGWLLFSICRVKLFDFSEPYLTTILTLSFGLNSFWFSSNPTLFAS